MSENELVKLSLNKIQDWISSIYAHYYEECKPYFKDHPNFAIASAELFPLLMVFVDLDLSGSLNRDNRTKVIAPIYKLAKWKYSQESSFDFSQRMGFYADFVRGKKAKSYWCSKEKYRNNLTIVAYINMLSAFVDVVHNPNMLFNYDGAVFDSEKCESEDFQNLMIDGFFEVGYSLGAEIQKHRAYFSDDYISKIDKS